MDNHNSLAINYGEFFLWMVSNIPILGRLAPNVAVFFFPGSGYYYIFGGCTIWLYITLTYHNIPIEYIYIYTQYIHMYTNDFWIKPPTDLVVDNHM